MKFPHLYLFIIITEESLQRTRHLDYGKLKYIADKLDPRECFYLIVYLTRRDARQLGNEHFAENWDEISNSHCLQSLVNWSDTTPDSSSRNLLRKALFKLGKSHLVAQFHETPSSERKIKHDEFHRNIISRSSDEKKKTEIVEDNDSNSVIYTMTGSLIILILFGFLLLVLHIRAMHSNFYLRNFEKNQNDNFCRNRFTNENRNNCCHDEVCDRVKLIIDSSGIESEDSLKPSTAIYKMKNARKQKMNNCHKQSKKRIKALSPFLKIKKLFTGNKKEENRVKYKRINNICGTNETRKKKCTSSKKCREKIKSRNSDAKKVVFHKFNEICTCEMCQLFDIGEDKLADIRGVDYIRSRERQIRKIRKKPKFQY